jgi:predicted Zn finger-like uncharacterized protein
MLLTRCPECDTTFRVTDETLKKASGQVRCGRCASVFNAYAELQDRGTKSPEPEARDRASKTATATPPPAPPKPVAVAEARGAAAEAAAEPRADQKPRDSQAITATEVDRVLADEQPSEVPYVWLRPEPRPQSRWWAVGSALALLALGAQALHYFRSDIAAHATFGPWLTAANSKVGAEIAPNWDVHQYEIIDSVAEAGEPNARGAGSLKITARIRNRGPRRQPYPTVALRLKDRYDTALASRMFAPAEYLPRDVPHERMMSPGETTRVDIEIVDPGPDASGFELDVCIEVEASLVTCGTDEVFR